MADLFQRARLFARRHKAILLMVLALAYAVTLFGVDDDAEWSLGPEKRRILSPPHPQDSVPPSDETTALPMPTMENVIALEFPEVPRSLQADATDNLTQTQVITQTCLVYVSVFVAMFAVFLVLRRCYPGVYNIKDHYVSLRTPVAADSYGFFSWMWRVFDVGYDQLREECGMDAACAIRLVEMGAKLSLVGALNSVYLIPTYSVMGDVVDEMGVHDPVKACSLSNLGQGHPGALATVVAAYIFFGCAMRIVDKDFEWLTYHRHKFLAGRRAQNYSVYLSGLPADMRTNAAIRAYFNHCFSHEAVADVHVALDIPELEKKVAKRDALLPKLEHAKNILEVKGKAPTRLVNPCTGEWVETIPIFTKEINDLEKEIGEDISTIKSSLAERDARTSGVDAAGGISQEQNHGLGLRAQLAKQRSSLEIQAAKLVKETIAAPVAVASDLKALVLGGDDGAPRNACFVSFNDLGSTNLARQAIHNQEPWECVPVEPPMPKLVNWKNVGKNNGQKQFGELLSFALVALLCVFWTIPVTFIASLSNVEALTEQLPFLRAPVENLHWFSNLLAVLAPLLLVGFIALLPYVLLTIIKFECLIEIETLQHPSLFAKLGAFTIIQTFFISTIASTLFASLQQMLDNPPSMLFQLSKALPSQATYFTQLILVQNLLSLGMELTRVMPISYNIARKIAAFIFGHNLTEKERSETFLGLRSFEDPLEYYFGTELGSKIVLLQMVLFVYGCMAPITSYFTLLIYGLLAIGYRHQFIFIYPPANDSGGKLWLNFTRLSVTCMIVAETVLLFVLILKEAFTPAILMVPLIGATLLFDIYFKRRHYAVTAFLPLGDCAAVDGQNDLNGIGCKWLKDEYLQPALKERGATP